MDGESVELLKRWVNGEEVALLEWLGAATGPEVSFLLEQKDRRIADRDRELRRRETEIDALRAELRNLRRRGPAMG